MFVLPLKIYNATLEVDNDTYLLVTIASSFILQNQEKMKRKLSSKTEEIRQGEASSVAQSAQEKLITDSRATSVDNKVVSATTAADATANVPTVVVNGPNMDRPKQEKVKGNSNDMKTTEILARKKQKFKPELELSECDARPDKLISQHSEEKNTPL